MLGDVLLITEKHTWAAEAIVKRVVAMNGPKNVIAISGESGSGKSELAHEVARQLKVKGTPAKIIHSDNYYKTTPQERNSWRKKHGLESIGYDEYDWDLINSNINAFRKDRGEVEIPCIDLMTDQEDRLITSFAGLRYLVIEGLYAIKADADLRIFIALTYHQTKKAQMVRGKEKMNEWRMQVLQREHAVISSLHSLAALVVDRDYHVAEA